MHVILIHPGLELAEHSLRKLRLIGRQILLLRQILRQIIELQISGSVS